MTAFPSPVVQSGLYLGMSTQEVGSGGGLSVPASGPLVGLGAVMHMCVFLSGVQDGPWLSLPCPALLALSILSHCYSLLFVCLWPLFYVSVPKLVCVRGRGVWGGGGRKHKGKAKATPTGSPGLREDMYKHLER